jgi:thiamine-phosphate pyrophosphorylase
VRPAFDPTLYLVTDPELGHGRALEAIVAAAVRGGVTLVQLRDKHKDGGPLLEEALRLKALLDPLGVPLLVNDRADVARAAGVGCHLGQSDLPPAVARDLLGPEALIGWSLDDPAQAERIDPEALDYIAFGPFAATATKRDAGPAVGAGQLSRVRARSALPLVAIGGIDPSNAGAAIRAGADGIAVVSAIMSADDPEAASRTLRRQIEAARGAKEGS